DLRTSGLSANNPGTFTATGSISGNTLTVTGTPGGTIALGEVLTGAGIPTGTTITALGTGTGGRGTYTIRTSLTVASETITLTDGKDKYFAGTQFTDTIAGENNVNNTYYYVGKSTTGTAPVDTFTGGTGTSWNVAVLPGARSNYMVSTNGGVT